jgi:hypothetical protein
MENIIPQGENTIRAHLEHLDSHGEAAFLAEALAVLRARGIPVPRWKSLGDAPSPAPSALGNWPIQLHLLAPMAAQLRTRDVLLSADCVAHACPDFHSRFLDGKALAIACPKLDDGREIYREKITALIDHAGIASLTVAMMEVPCCRGLLRIAQEAREKAHRPVPLTALVVSIDGGTVIAEERL